MSTKVNYYDDEGPPLDEIDVEEGLKKKLLEIRAFNDEKDHIYASEVNENEEGLELIMGDGTQFLITCKKVK
ncbi:hypothetical protein DRN34_01790 [Thermococci archaeon]|nr:MAG: hypothetical protein DRN34_01790 [Thermococci archaeon]